MKVKTEKPMLFFHCPAGLRSTQKIRQSSLLKNNGAKCLSSYHGQVDDSDQETLFTELESEGEHICFENFRQLEIDTSRPDCIQAYKKIIESVIPQTETKLDTPGPDGRGSNSMKQSNTCGIRLRAESDMEKLPNEEKVRANGFDNESLYMRQRSTLTDSRASHLLTQMNKLDGESVFREDEHCIEHSFHEAPRNCEIQDAVVPGRNSIENICHRLKGKSLNLQSLQKSVNRQSKFPTTQLPLIEKVEKIITIRRHTMKRFCKTSDFHAMSANFGIGVMQDKAFEFTYSSNVQNRTVVHSLKTKLDYEESETLLSSDSTRSPVLPVTTVASV
ncbi:unnamed protein product [Dicrocoelium dendriticum]|nr:unnamed protein product [Dicrocoelium dendriticum]